jgi:hypothetical protein
MRLFCCPGLILISFQIRGEEIISAERADGFHNYNDKKRAPHFQRIIFLSFVLPCQQLHKGGWLKNHRTEAEYNI